MSFTIDEWLAERILTYSPVELLQSYLAESLVLQIMSAHCSTFSCGKDDGLVTIEDAETHGKTTQIVALVNLLSIVQLAVEELLGIAWCEDVQGEETFRILIIVRLQYS